ncbi:hypothetical protein AVDCRST_MAG81-2067 [uncultured Synechococcales cyanobacterium]|uniref:Uncharacterized protein n=1 Tax=uncultured Synechococcales cyanobacterium TaxID=1936017 RepID=A0A6J4VB42_9CYAN|nr:hypothetical protein AVDCRST_MAG81-2067 [uncultured Synechococcales cyanobacterium]
MICYQAQISSGPTSGDSFSTCIFTCKLFGLVYPVPQPYLAVLLS